MKVLIAFIIVFFALILGACSSSPSDADIQTAIAQTEVARPPAPTPTQKPEELSYSVEYRVQGTSEKASIRYKIEFRNKFQEKDISGDRPLNQSPWYRHSEKFEYGDFLFLEATNEAVHGYIECQILVNGQSISEVISRGFKSKAHCVAVVGFD